MTDMPLKAKVQCSDGACGKVTNVVINPVTQHVSHIAIENKDLPKNSTRLIPLDLVASSTPSEVVLKCSIADVAAMQPFVVDSFVKATGSGQAYSSGDAYSSQFVYNDSGYDNVQSEIVPKGELAIYSGLPIEASDGKLGKLDELVIDPKTGDLTHIQMREGHLFGKKDVAIPIADIDFFDGETIYLKLDKKAVKALPAVKVKR